jgi:hypothetical protein
MPAGYEASDEGDCNDNNTAVYPGAAESCSDLAIDNDCDGSTAESEAGDALTFYGDSDNDGAGDPNVTVLACSAPAGYVGVAGDNCPNNGARVNPVTWYADTDADGVGDAASTLSACDQPQGYVATAGDLCPADGNKLDPGACGCGTPDTDGNSDGNPDCFGQIAALTLAADMSVYAPMEQVIVRVNSGASGTGLRGANLSIVFNAVQLEFVSASPVVGSPYSVEGVEIVDNSTGTLRYTVSVPAANAAVTDAAPVADLVFNLRRGASFCDQSGLVTFGVVGGESSRMVTTTSVAMVPTVSPLGAISALSLPPSFDVAPANVAVAADAGSIAGAVVADPMIEALDSCGNPAVVSFAITYPDNSTGSSWPAGGVFPIGVSTIAYTATDDVGQDTTASVTVTVANYQLLDVDVSLAGAITGNASRTIRVSAGSSVQVFEVPMTAGVGGIDGIQVPVAADYNCLLVKDPQHSLSKSAAASVAGVRYSAAAALKQGDSNGDDLVDILDFGLFVGDFGAEPTGRGISNFNADAVVNNADFSFIALNFVTRGETCGSFTPPGQPITRISVKELRRRGLGELVQADFNRDGWVDTRDIAIYMQGAPVELGTAN